MRAIGKVNCPTSRPLTLKLGEQACALGMPACRHQPKSKNDTCGRFARGEQSESHDKIQLFERVIAKDASTQLQCLSRPLVPAWNIDRAAIPPYSI